MPQTLFHQDIRKRPSPGLEHILKWRERYKTSKVATTRRFVDLSDGLAAMLVTKNGTIKQLHRKPAFPYIELRYGQSVHAKTLTATYLDSSDECSDTLPTEPSLWIAKTLPRGAEMYEQVLLQSEGYRITLLTIDESDTEDDDEEYARDRAEGRPTFC